MSAKKQIHYNERFKLVNALMIYEHIPASYENDYRYGLNSKESYYAEIHNVAIAPSGKPHLLAGRSLTAKGAGAISKMLSVGKTCEKPLGLLSSRVLTFKNRPYDQAIMWWSPSQERILYFLQQSGKVNCPPMLFLLKNRTLHVFAMKTERRPTEKTPLYQVPFSNTYHGTGEVCMGNTPLPKEEGSINDEIVAWERTYFGSKFTSTPIEYETLLKNGGKYPKDQLDRNRQCRTLGDLLAKYDL